MAKTPEFDPREAKKNYFINGDMRISQRHTTFTSIANGAYSLDRYVYYKVGAMVHTITQDTDVPTVAQSGYLFQNSLRLNLTTPDTAIAAGDVAAITQKIEGYNWANLAQKPFTVSFWVKATLPGTYCVAFQNFGNDRSYVAEYTISLANTWEYKTITVLASPSAGSWNYSNGNGLEVNWTLAAGTNFQQTAGSWQTNAGAKYATANQINGVNTGSTDFRLTGIMINEGYEALPFKTFADGFEGELTACQRYAQSSFPSGVAWAQAAGVTGAEYTRFNGASNLSMTINFPVQMRASPNLTTYNPVVANGNARNTDAGVDVPFVDLQVTSRSHSVAFNSGGTGIYRWHYSVEAEL